MKLKCILSGFSLLVLALDAYAIRTVHHEGSINNGHVVKECFVEENVNGPRKSCEPQDRAPASLVKKDVQEISVPAGQVIDRDGGASTVKVVVDRKDSKVIVKESGSETTVCRKVGKKKVCKTVPAEPLQVDKTDDVPPLADGVNVQPAQPIQGVAVVVPPANLPAGIPSADKVLPSSIYPEFKVFVDNELNQFLINASFLFMEHGYCQNKRDGDSIEVSGSDCMVEVRLRSDEQRRAVFHKFSKLEFERDRPSQPRLTPLKVSFESEGNGVGKQFIKGYWQLTNTDEIKLDLTSTDGVEIKSETSGDSRLDNFNLF